MKQNNGAIVRTVTTGTDFILHELNTDMKRFLFRFQWQIFSFQVFRCLRRRWTQKHTHTHTLTQKGATNVATDVDI